MHFPEKPAALRRTQGPDDRPQDIADPASMRGGYSVPGAGLLESDALADPMQQFARWCTLQPSLAFAYAYNLSELVPYWCMTLLILISTSSSSLMSILS